jgi:CO/xanthine dehydrogenase Mo-binding subunit
MTYVGQRVPSLTNERLVAGKGTFVDDVRLPGMTYMADFFEAFSHELEAERAASPL